MIALTARDMAAGIREKKFSSGELVAAHVAQIEATSPAINAVALAKAVEDATGGWQPPEI